MSTWRNASRWLGLVICLMPVVWMGVSLTNAGTFLASTVPAQWNNGEVSNWLPGWAVALVPVLGCGIAGIVAVAGAVTRPQRLGLIYWLSFGFGLMFLMIWFGLLKLGSSADGAPAVEPDLFLAAPLLLLAGVVPWALVRTGHRDPAVAASGSASDRRGDSLLGQPVVWVGSAVNPLMLVVAAVAAAATTVLALTGADVLLTVIVGVVVVASTVAFGSVHVAIDEREIRVRSWLGLPRKMMPLANVADVRAVETSFAQWGGLGYRVGPRGAGFIVRSGTAIEVRTADSLFTVTVDGASEGASVAEALVARSHREL